MSMSETTLIPGNASDWQEFAVEDYDKQAAPGSDEDTLGAFLKEQEAPFGIVLVADPIEDVPDNLVKRLAALRIPTKVRRESRGEEKPGEKKKAKAKAKDKDKDDE
jgi:hypothetical protein